MSALGEQLMLHAPQAQAILDWMARKDAEIWKSIKSKSDGIEPDSWLMQQIGKADLLTKDLQSFLKQCEAEARKRKGKKSERPED